MGKSRNDVGERQRQTSIVRGRDPGMQDPPEIVPEGRLHSIANRVYTASGQGGGKLGVAVFRRVAEVGQNRYVGVAIVGSFAGVLLLLLFIFLRSPKDTVVLNVQPLDDPSIIRVYIGGEVASPGLYSLPRGSRIFDGVNAAGGLLMSADTSMLGLASPLQDADQVIVPARAIDLSTPQPVNPVSATPEGTSSGTGSSETPVSQPTPVTGASNRVNINTANVAELQALPGIGPAIAGRIVDYRMLHGPFQTLEELADVSGISERMVEDLRPLLTLGP